MNASGKWIVVLLATASIPARLHATEPNEGFWQATVLAPGIRSVVDTLTPGYVSYPDTMLGIRGLYGDIYYVDDDGSPLGDGYASGVGGVSTNYGSINFAVTGNPDQYFEGNHSRSGGYTVYIDTYYLPDYPISSFSVTATLQPGAVDEYSYNDYNWIGAYYDVYIDNTVGGVSSADVDFFTFTGAAPGASFSVQTKSTTGATADTLLGWFDDSGTLLNYDDDSGVGYLSLLAGTVPTSGKLTFAVTGHGDNAFVGSHVEDGGYQLEITIATSLRGDFDGDGDVDGQDFLRWQRNPSLGTLADWQAGYGTPLVASATAVPEPSIQLSLLVVMGSITLKHYRRVR